MDVFEKAREAATTAIRECMAYFEHNVDEENEAAAPAVKACIKAMRLLAPAPAPPTGACEAGELIAAAGLETVAIPCRQCGRLPAVRWNGDNPAELRCVGCDTAYVLTAEWVAANTTAPPAVAGDVPEWCKRAGERVWMMHRPNAASGAELTDLFAKMIAQEFAHIAAAHAEQVKRLREALRECRAAVEQGRMKTTLTAEQRGVVMKYDIALVASYDHMRDTFTAAIATADAALAEGAK